MVSCTVRTCSSRSGADKKKSTGITFHRFPKDATRCEAWRKFVRRGAWQPTKYSVLCSKHFSEECFDRTSLCYVRLREDAVPTLYQMEEFPKPGFDALINNYNYRHETDEKELLTKLDLGKIKQEYEIKDYSICNETYADVKTEQPDFLLEEMVAGRGFEKKAIKHEVVLDTEAIKLEELIIKSEDVEDNSLNQTNEPAEVTQNYTSRRRRKLNDDDDELTPYTCWVCKEEFNRKRNFDAHNLKYHKNQAHSITSKVHYCKECDYKTVHKTHLKLHMHQHSPNVERFSCRNCPYSTHDKSHLKRHMFTHTKKRSFPCGACKKNFNSKKQFDAHIKSHKTIQ